MRSWLLVAGLLLVAAPAMGATGDVLVVATDDAELSKALVHAASQQFSGPVALAPADWSGPVKEGTLRLRVSPHGSNWRVVLAGPLASVSRDLKIRSPVRLDVAESIALALPGLEARLRKKTQAVEDLRAAEAARARAQAAAAQVAAAKEVRSQPQPAPPPPPPAPLKEVPIRAAPEKPEPPVRPLLVSIVTPPPPTNTVGVTLAPGVLSAHHLVGVGADISSQIVFHGPWLGRISVGAYQASLHDSSIWIFPLDVLVGGRLTRGRFHFDAAGGGEINIATGPLETGVVTSIVGQLTASMHVTKAWSFGLRLAGAYTTDTSEVDDSVGHDLYIPQAQFRIGFVGTWESAE